METRNFTFLLIFMLLLQPTLYSQTSNYWDGSVNSSWNNADNWSLGHVPSTSEKAVIEDVTNNPVLDINTTIAAIQIDSAASLDLNGNTLKVKQDWNNSGTLIPNSGKVTFSGTQKQYIYGKQSFYNLDIDNNSGVEIASDTSGIKGILTVISGTLTTNGSLVIESDSSGTGSVAPISGAISGDVTVQRYIPITFQDWRSLSSPIKNGTLNEIYDDMWTTGFPGSSNPSHWFTSVYTYVESDTGASNYGWKAPSSIDDTLKSGQGFNSFMGTASFGGNLDFHGELRNGDVTVDVSFTDSGNSGDGWNLVGNPFASAIDWDDADISRTNLDNAIYIWNPEKGTYASYVAGIGSNGGSNLIASCQAFWVKANGANPILEIPQSAKSNSSATFIKQSQYNYLTISISNGSTTDETILKANPNAQESYEGSLDALKFSPTNGNNPTIYSSFSNQSEIFSINQFEVAEKTVQLYARTGVSGTHSLTFEGITSFEKSPCLVLKDLFTGQEYTLTEGQTINVDLSDTTTVPRFELKIGAPVTTNLTNVSCHDFNDGEISFEKITDSLYDIEWKDEFGTNIKQENGVFQYSFVENLEAGTYIINSSDHLCGQRVDTIVIGEPAEIVVDFSASQDTVYIDGSGNPVMVDLQNNSQFANSYKWITNNDIVFAQNYTMEISNEGIHPVTLYAYQKSQCYKSIQKEIVAVSTATVDESDGLTNAQVYSNENKIYLKGLSENTTVNISNVNGQLLYSGIANNNEIIEMNNISTQMLIVNLISDQYQETRKVFFK